MPPWLQSVYAEIDSLWARKPQALCLVHPVGVPVDPLRDAITQALVCNAQQFPACGQCTSCRHSLGEGHPDVLPVTPEGSAGMIPVDAVRHAIGLSQTTASLGGQRVIQVRPANALNRSSANALLKWVEEPPPGTVWLFETAWPGKLLPTLVSRLRMIRIAPPSHEDLLAYAQLHGRSDSDVEAGRRLLGEPLACLVSSERLDLAREIESLLNRAVHGEDPTTLAQACQKKDAKTVLAVMTSIIEASIRNSMDPATEGRVPEPRWLIQVLDRVLEVKGQAEANIAVNLPLAMGVLLAAWAFVWTKVQSPA